MKLIKGATKSVIKNHQHLLEKGMNPNALPDVGMGGSGEK